MPVLGRSWDTRGAVGTVDWHNWACRKALGGLEELTLLGRLEAKTLVDPTLSLALKYGKVSKSQIYSSIQDNII